jgi:hypothetical protein
MAVTITTIQPQDSIASSRLTLNSNFSALKAGIDAVQLLINPTTSVLSGVKSATINDNASSLSTTIFQVGKGSALLGNVILGTVGASTSVLLNGNGGVTINQPTVNVSTGNLTLSSASSLADFKGNVSVGTELRLPGSATAFASIIGLTSSVTTTITVTDKKYIVVRNDSSSAGLTASLSAGTLGQVVEIFHILGPSSHPVNIDALNFSGLTGGIQMKKTGDTLKCVFDGAAWYLWNYSAASFAAVGAGATSSSITFTTT